MLLCYSLFFYYSKLYQTFATGAPIGGNIEGGESNPSSRFSRPHTFPYCWVPIFYCVPNREIVLL